MVRSCSSGHESATRVALQCVKSGGTLCLVGLHQFEQRLPIFQVAVREVLTSAVLSWMGEWCMLTFCWAGLVFGVGRHQGHLPLLQHVPHVHLVVSIRRSERAAADHSPIPHLFRVQ